MGAQDKDVGFHIKNTNFQWCYVEALVQNKVTHPLGYHGTPPQLSPPMLPATNTREQLVLKQFFTAVAVLLATNIHKMQTEVTLNGNEC